MGVPLRKLTEAAAAQWLGVEVVTVQVDPETQEVVTVPREMTPERRAKFVRAMEDLARQWVE